MLEAAPLAGGQWQGAEKVQCRGIKGPKCWVLLACGTACACQLCADSQVLLTELAGIKVPKAVVGCPFSLGLGGEWG